MDYVTYGLLFLAGALTSYVFIQRSTGPFEKLIWAGLRMGKRVVICMNNEAMIFELKGNRLRITRADMEFTEGDDDGFTTDDMANIRDLKSTNLGMGDLRDGEGE